MWLIETSANSRNIFWTYGEGEDEEGVTVAFKFSSSRQHQRRELIKIVENLIKNSDVDWITPRFKEWTFDLSILKKEFPEMSSMKWLEGKVSIEPEFEPMERLEWADEGFYDSKLVFYIIPKELNKLNLSEPPIEIKESLKLFKKDYPDISKVAFIMMQFGDSKAHGSIVNAIKKVLESHGIIGVRADDKQYHDDLLPNVLTYIFGCNFGIAVFERIKAEEFNPNVSLEVGYMLALKKPLCLLKDDTLKTLQADLVGRLYKEFDPQDPENRINKELTKWLSDKEII